MTTTTEPSAPTPVFEWNWRSIWDHYVDPPYRYQAIEIVEHIPSGNLKLKCYGGRSGGWTEVWIKKEDRVSLAKALLGDDMTDPGTHDDAGQPATEGGVTE